MWTSDEAGRGPPHDDLTHHIIDIRGWLAAIGLIGAEVLGLPAHIDTISALGHLYIGEKHRGVYKGLPNSTLLDPRCAEFDEPIRRHPPEHGLVAQPPGDFTMHGWECPAPVARPRGKKGRFGDPAGGHGAVAAAPARPESCRPA